MYDDRGLRIKALPPLPVIRINVGDKSISSGDTVNFYAVGNNEEKEFTVLNQGHLNLNLGNISISGANASLFQITKQPDSVVYPGGSTTFKIKFQPDSVGFKSAELNIPNNDPYGNPFKIILYGNYAPEMQIDNFPNGSDYDFDTVNIGDFMRASFRIRNLAVAGSWPLYLTGTLHVEIRGPDAYCFSIEQQPVGQPAGQIQPGQYADFIVQFTPQGGEGPKEAYLFISNNDPDDNPHIIYLYGTAAYGPMKLIEDDKLSIGSVAGNEILKNTHKIISWKVDEKTAFVRIEYSLDNGSTYIPIADRVPNNGRYEWLVPSEVSKSCLIRITDADKPVFSQHQIFFDLNMKVSRPMKLLSSPPAFTALLAVPDPLRQAILKLELQIIPYEAKRLFQIAGNGVWTKAIYYEVFLERWHNINVEFNLKNSTASVWINNELVLEDVGLNVETALITPKSKGIINFKAFGEPGSVIWVDEVEVRIPDTGWALDDGGSGNVFWQRLFKEDFDDYENDDELMNYGGWVVGQPEEASYGQTFMMRAYERSPVSKLMKSLSSLIGPNGKEFLSGQRSMKVTVSKEGTTEVVKTFALPEGVPFIISQNKFQVVDRLSLREALEKGFGVKREKEKRDGSWIWRYREPEPSLIEKIKTISSLPMDGIKKGSGGSGALRTMSVGEIGIYYIYSFDGRLLAEYDGYRNCLREYIYVGAKMVAEYQPAQNKYYFYTTDQINSTRVVTDENGNVVYAAVHDPYGGKHHTYVNAFDPVWKFSGEELYYFGARYYDPALYRLHGPDPVIPTDVALYAPQRWNLYGYCLGNPQNLVDPDGRWSKYVHFNWTFELAKKIHLPDSIAYSIARANAEVDHDLRTTSYNPYGYRYHFPLEQHLNQAYKIASSTLDPKEFGRALHTIQDWYCHRQFANRPYGGHAPESIMGWFSGDPMNDPDYAFRDLDILSDMLRETERLLEEYKSRLVQAVGAIIFSALPLFPFL